MRSFSTTSRWQSSVGQFELAQQRLGELLERVGENDDLHERAQFIEKFLSARAAAAACR